jgi:diacylglycerol kinase family enzyme
MKVLLVVNPSASAVTARSRVMIQNALSADHDLVVSETSRRGHATRLAQSAAAEGYNLVISLGGDGTVNEVTNGLARTTTALGVLPGGSTNVFSRTLGFDNEPVAATHQLLDAVSRDSIRRVGLGNVNGRFFCFHVGLGLDAAVVEQVEKRGQLKRWLGHPLFLFAAVDTWARKYDRKTPPFRVRTGNPVAGSTSGHHESDSFFAVVLNTDPYTYLGSRPLSLAPGSNLANGLSMVSLRNLKLLPTLHALTRAFRRKSIAGLENVVVENDVDGLTITGYRPFHWQVDGDHLGEIREVTIQWEPDVLNLVMP